MGNETRHYSSSSSAFRYASASEGISATLFEERVQRYFGAMACARGMDPLAGHRRRRPGTDQNRPVGICDEPELTARFTFGTRKYRHQERAAAIEARRVFGYFIGPRSYG